MSNQKKYRLSALEVAELSTSYLLAEHGIALEVDHEKLARLIGHSRSEDKNTGKTGKSEKDAGGPPRVGNIGVLDARGQAIKILEVNRKTKKIVFELPSGYPVFLPNPDRRSFYASTPVGRPAVAQVYLSFKDKTRVVLEKKLKRELTVGQSLVDSLEVGKLGKQKKFAKWHADHEKSLEKAKKAKKKGKSTSSSTTRKKNRIREHKNKFSKKSPKCTCNSSGWKCKAVTDHGKKAYKKKALKKAGF